MLIDVIKLFLFQFFYLMCLNIFWEMLKGT